MEGKSAEHHPRTNEKERHDSNVGADTCTERRKSYSSFTSIGSTNLPYSEQLHSGVSDASILSSGYQTPAASRPQSRRMASFGSRLEQSSEAGGDDTVITEPNNMFLPQFHRLDATVQDLNQFQHTQYSGPQATDNKNAASQPSSRRPLPSTSQDPSPSARQIFEKVNEVETFTKRLQHEADRHQGEMVEVQFALDRISEQQQDQMRKQTLLFDRLADMDVRAKRAREGEDKEGKS